MKNRKTTSIHNLDVLYEDNHLIAVNKRAGDIAQGDETGDAPLGEYVKEYIKHHYKKEGKVYLGVVHRLDRPVSGVMLFARTSKALERMNQMFRSKKVKKTYYALTTSRPKYEEGTLTHHITRIPSRNQSIAHLKPQGDSKKARLHYELLACLGNHYLLKVTPFTGRQHQIRVQLARIACPIRGDKKYGAPKYNKDRSIHLHAYELSFMHPVKKELITINTAPAMWDDTWRMFQEWF